MLPVVRQVAGLLRRSRYTVALTGAGMSTASGIPDFRSPHAGLWALADPLAVASVWAFAEHPDNFYRWFRPLLERSLTARPNAAHRILVEMEARVRLETIITQNIDSLHQDAGSRRVLQLHGHLASATCLACGCCVPGVPLWQTVLQNDAPPLCPQCHGWLKPDVVLFGEPIPYEVLQAAQQEALHCDLMLVIGTSLEVMPAADLPLLARRRGARVVLINLTPTELDGNFDVVIHADVVRTLQELRQELERA